MKYVKVFLFSSILFGVAMGLLFTLLGEDGVSSGIVAGLFFGLFMTVVLGITDFVSGKKLGGKGSKGVHQQDDLSLHVGIEDAFERCKQSLTLLKDVEIKEENKQEGSLVAHTGATWKTFGEVVNIQLREEDFTVTHIHIESRPLAKQTLIDYGKNYENVKTIRDSLEPKANTELSSS
ncbi:hypothetical protein N781_03060 [Pontibacillus halophilus JSM 076056 = DSM 19796]|uniref:Uncharacterized protein n=1 Tax=Pontibacillus halophilus JSM 076056 = DSM 19796 TaxID=1385510 RepID=A0A0A5GFR7_9BACI|nr:hypothetical protein [Pontibacillus halophilus]KGX92081.1 hypothetical protein N781_03060 [Pontibacillus halophilus JSM 076056 = DSM 19796]